MVAEDSVVGCGIDCQRRHSYTHMRHSERNTRTHIEKKKKKNIAN